ncbi:sorbitol-6-phosphate 2-dehydrogenase [Carnobacterium sp. 17-4]|uniref:sorbitol-6-phosphate dehydrogenase subunit n=1 Tax=Carnobacterium sp. (strain 17-4) TaxID=208596 RepID=UPI0002058B06|nr:sorbitol-6-phosphate dehydrogenase subunit [Carnobacterium sp. 17-4]AEB30107.1 sorbitol-6-phosphate 2-dehydrogenase [Carnobacterium sp. 17-4]
MTNDWLELKDKNVIVTGGASGIGLHIVNELKNNGATVIVADLNVEDGEKNGVYNIKTDVTSVESVNGLVKKASEKYGIIHVLVNNAGINQPRLLVDLFSDKGNYEVNEKMFDLLVNINQKGVVLTTQAVVRNMLAKNTLGTIINISSESGLEGSVGQSIYSGTKGAVNSYTRSWAKELGSKGIRVVGVAPGINEKTGLTTPAYNEALAYTRNISVDQVDVGYEKNIPLGRVGKLDDIANLVSFLASEKSSYITGTVINITGGKSRG